MTIWFWNFFFEHLVHSSYLGTEYTVLSMFDTESNFQEHFLKLEIVIRFQQLFEGYLGHLGLISKLFYD